ncbi:hypothetical protein [Paenibacillus xylanexedens]|nr:hypothetical protein [Paenibacillus xylanexedens]
MPDLLYKKKLSKLAVRNKAASFFIFSLRKWNIVGYIGYDLIL